MRCGRALRNYICKGLLPSQSAFNACTATCVEGGPTGGVVRSRSVDPSNELSLCRHCHPVDGTFDTLVHAISPKFNVLTKVSKEVEKSNIASRYR